MLQKNNWPQIWLLGGVEYFFSISEGIFGETIQLDLIKFESWKNCADLTVPFISRKSTHTHANSYCFAFHVQSKAWHNIILPSVLLYQKSKKTKQSWNYGIAVPLAIWLGGIVSASWKLVVYKVWGFTIHFSLKRRLYLRSKIYSHAVSTTMACTDG